MIERGGGEVDTTLVFSLYCWVDEKQSDNVSSFYQYLRVHINCVFTIDVLLLLNVPMQFNEITSL